MNQTTKEISRFLSDIQHVKVNDKLEAIICAPFPYLQTLVTQTKDLPLQVGAQTMHFQQQGAYTGEVSPTMLQDIGVSHVIIGHSERRQYFNETDLAVNKKVIAAHESNLVPIVCVGESLEQYEAGETYKHIETQITIALKNLSEAQIERTMIAYEPIWAIGTGKTASSEYANDVCRYIRTVIKKLTSEHTANNIIIQYGGSVNEDNIGKLLEESHIDGALVGGASLEAESFLQLIEIGNNKHE